MSRIGNQTVILYTLIKAVTNEKQFEEVTQINW